nr:hypothetical protein [Tanacetum cinerariifolium]
SRGAPAPKRCADGGRLPQATRTIPAGRHEDAHAPRSTGSPHWREFPRRPALPGARPPGCGRHR